MDSSKTQRPNVIPSIEILGMQSKIDIVVEYADADDEELLEQRDKVKREIEELGEMLKKRDE